MPIRGLTDRSGAFPRVGVLRKGGEKKDERRPGADLTYFRFDTDDADAREAFRATYGDEPQHINVYLPYQTVDENFQAWQEAWSASALQHRCDGEACTRWIGKDGRYHTDPRPCPGGCKPVARLMVIVPELQRLAYVTVLTTAINDIVTLHENLTAAELLRGDLRGIPFVLSRRARQISTPRDGGKRARVEKWLLSIEPAPHWVRYHLQALGQSALPHVKQLTDGATVDTLTGEVLESPEYEDESGFFVEEVSETTAATEQAQQNPELIALKRELHAARQELERLSPEAYKQRPTNEQVAAMNPEQLRMELMTTRMVIRRHEPPATDDGQADWLEGEEEEQQAA